MARRFATWSPVCALLMLSLACGGTPTSPSSDNPSAGQLQYTTAHFVFHHSAADAASIVAIADRAESQHARIVSELQAGTMPVVHVNYYATRAELVAAVRPIVGDIPSWASGLVTAADQIHLVSPVGSGAADPQAAAAHVVHEFSHCVAMRLEPRSPNNPRWLWETVAVYEARQFVHPSRLSYLVAGQPPTLTELSSFDNTRIYDVGYLIGEFVVEHWGSNALPQLIRSFGNTRAALGIEQSDFERQWFEAVRARYGL